MRELKWDIFFLEDEVQELKVEERWCGRGKGRRGLWGGYSENIGYF